MKFWNLLTSKFQGPNRSQTRGGRLEKPRLNRLSLEALEERTTPASFASFLEEIPLGGERFAPVLLTQNTLLSQSAPISYASIAFLDQELVGRVPGEELFGSLVVTLQPGEDPLVQIGEALSGYSGIETVRIISHGKDGALVLGGKVVDEASLNRQITEVSAWGRALALDADILLYGCSVASTEAGRQFVARLALATGADVAASSDPTGARGDLILEYATGPVQGSLVATQRAWEASGVQLPSEGDYSYTTSGGNATITGYTGAGGAVTVPSTLGGFSVTAIGDQAFRDKTSLTSITLPNSVTTIGREEFWGCSSLTSVTLPNSLIDIPYAAFVYCTGLTSITLPNSITTIGEYAFYGCTGLTSVTLPNSVTSIVHQGFYGCTSLTSITLGNSLTSIGNEAFWECTGLTSIYALGNAPTLGSNVFLNAPATVYYYRSATGFTGTLGGRPTQSRITPTTNTVVTSATPSVYGTSITLTTTVVASLGVPTGTVTFKDGSTVLGTANLSSGVASFSLSTLSAGSRSLTTVYAYTATPDPTTDTFDASTTPTLTQTVSAKGLTVSGTTASNKVYDGGTTSTLTGTSVLVGVISPDNVTLGGTAVGTFASANVANGITVNIAGFTISGSSNYTLTQPSTTANITATPEGDFSSTVTDSKVTITGYTGASVAVAIPATIAGLPVTTIGDNSFRDKTSLTSITLPNSVTTIGSSAFQGCTGLTSITLGNSLTTIGDFAFSGLTSLTSIYALGNAPTLGGGSVFSGVTATVYYYLAATGFTSTLGGLTTQSRITPTTNTVVTSATPSVYGTSTTLTTTVVASLGVATGTVTFKDGSTVLGTATLSSGVASFSLSTLSAGSHSLTAVYAYSATPDPTTDTFDASTSPTLTQTVSAKVLTVSGTTASNKVYDGGTTSTLSTGSSALVGVISPDEVTLGGTAVGTFNSANVANGITVNIAGFTISGSSSSNYTLTPPTTTADITATPESDFTSTVTDGKVTITGYTGASVAVAIPATIAGLPVTTIGDNSFRDKPSLTSITLPNSVTTIGEYAFRSCTSLTSITLPNSLTTIWGGAFMYCNSLTSITLPNSLTTIGNWAFHLCSSLTSITLPNSVTTIGNNAFKMCYSLTSVTLSNSLTSIEFGMFDTCSSLTSITLPNSITAIGEYAFKLCTGLTSIYALGNAPTLGSSVFENVPATVYYLPATTGWTNPWAGLTTVPFLFNFTISGSAITITGYNGPAGAVTVPATIAGLPVTTIGTYAFSGSTGLTSLTLPNSLTTILNAAFSSCSLTSITLPNSLTTIGDYAFEFCSGLTSITLPASVTTIGGGAFAYCTGLTAIYVNSTNLNYSSVDEILFNKDQTTVIAFPAGKTGAITLPSTVTTIGNDAFRGCTGLTSITLPNSVTTIGGWAFVGCTGLSSITLPNSITTIGSWAFESCTGLTSITLPNTITTIGEGAFGSCTGLTSITLPNSITTIVAHTFGGCSSLTSITLPNSVTTIGYNAFYNCTGLTSITLPNGVTTIGTDAFRGCLSLTSITLGNSITTIGYAAFAYCTGLTSITLGNSVITIGDNAFYQCTSLTSITLPNSVTTIGNSVFWGCTSLISITLPNSITTIEGNAFAYCTSLTSITLPNSLTTIGHNMFQGCTGLASITLPSSLTTIGGAAFWGCTSLTSITLSNSITTIGDWAFAGCSGLTSITLPNSITTIGAYAFQGCSGLTSITLPSTVTTIGEAAFYGCNGLTSITLPNSLTTIGAYAFYGCYGLTSITLPNSLTTIGAYAFYGCTGLTSITLPNSITTIGEYAFEICTSLTSIYALGNAPTLGGSVFSGVPATVYYYLAATGFTNPWGGLTTQSISTPTTNTVVTSATPSVYGDSITLTTTVVASLGVPTGTVTFKDGSTVLGTANLNGSAVATFSLSTLAPGSHSLTSVYTATDNFDASTSPTLTQTVSKANQSISWSTPTAITLGLPLSSTQLSASVSGVAGGSAAGDLTYDFPLGTVLSSGTHTLGVTAASTTNYNQATGSVSITVNPYFTDPSPSSSNGFGTVIVTLSGGNVVITAPYDDFAATDAGAVYLFSGTTGALISTLRGATANDQIGITGVTALSNGNFVIRSATWDNGAATDAGAVTFGNATTGVSGSVSSSNSLVGSSSSDNVGSYAILALTNGNYVVNSPDWNNGSVVDAGAVTFGAGDSGVSGAISSVNSLVGSSTTDKVGSSGVTALANANYVVQSQLWGTVGAVTWGSGTSGITGAVSSTNSITGSTPNDFVGNTVITALTGGNFVLVSPNWDNGSGNSAGAATWLDGTTGKTILGAFGALSSTNSLVGSSSRNGDSVGANGVASLTNGNFVVISASWNGIRGAATWGSANAGVVGEVSSSNSMIGDAVGANVGSGGVTALTGGNYVINSYNWSSNKGAVTFGIGSTGTSGTVAEENSLVGSVNGSYVGLDGMSQLANNNYVVKSSLWNNGTVAVGAATFASGSSGVSGTVSSVNSLVGSSAGDKVGAEITTLTNNNYVVVSSSWTGAAASVGAITWGSGSSGVSGVVSSTNSLIGSAENDQIGSGGITVLTNNNYIVSSPLWNNGSTLDTGAVTWGNGASGSTGALSTSNSLVGSNTTDKIGSGGITALGANYVVASPLWNNSSVVDAGSVTWGNGSGQVTTGAVTSSNSFVGSDTNDKVGSGGITVLSNNNFVVSSPLWNNGAATTAGAATWGNGASGSAGTIGSTNSLVGSTIGDQLGSGGITALTGNGNYTIASPLWNNGGTSDVGAVTFGNGDGSTKGTVASGNSLIGSTAFDQVGSGGVTALSSGNYLVSSASWNNGGLANAGAVTWGRGTIEGGVGGVSGAVSTSNSTVGSVANANLQSITLNGIGGTYLVSFLSDGSGPRVNYGFQNPTDPVFTNASSTTYTIGVSKSFTFSATGNPTPAFSLISVTGAGTSLPSGLSFNNSTGVLSGTAGVGTAGTYTLTVRATNGLGVNVDQTFTLTVS